MRELKRIDRILRKINFIWKKYPDMRFGQLIENLWSCYSGYKWSFTGRSNFSTWDLEDTDFEKFLNNFKGF